MVPNSLKRKARESAHSRFFHAASVRKGGAVLATEENSGVCGERHAEVRAVERATHRHRSIKGATVVSIRVTRSGKLASARPCNACMDVLIKAGVKKVVYSTAAGTLEVMKL